MNFQIKDWAAWSPSLTTKESWIHWVNSGEESIFGGDIPSVAGMPPLLKRRAQRLGRMALEVMYSMPEGDIPIIYCSRHGELDRGLSLLKELALTSSLSPQNFSMAVHNSIPSLYTIAEKKHTNILAISAGKNSAMAGLLEAIAVLQESPQGVRLVVANEPVPSEYEIFTDESTFPYAYSLDISIGGPYSLSLNQNFNSQSLVGVNCDLDLFKFFIGIETTFEYRQQGFNYLFKKAVDV